MPRATKKNLGRKKNTKTRRNRKNFKNSKRGGDALEELKFDNEKTCYRNFVLKIIHTHGDKKQEKTIDIINKPFLGIGQETNNVSFIRLASNEDEKRGGSVFGTGMKAKIQRQVAKEQVKKKFKGFRSSIRKGLSSFKENVSRYTGLTKEKTPVFLFPILQDRIIATPKRITCLKTINEHKFPEMNSTPKPVYNLEEVKVDGTGYGGYEETTNTLDKYIEIVFKVDNNTFYYGKGIKIEKYNKELEEAKRKENGVETLEKDDTKHNLYVTVDYVNLQKYKYNENYLKDNTDPFEKDVLNEEVLSENLKTQEISTKSFEIIRLLVKYVAEAEQQSKQSKTTTITTTSDSNPTDNTSSTF